MKYLIIFILILILILVYNKHEKFQSTTKCSNNKTINKGVYVHSLNWDWNITGTDKKLSNYTSYDLMENFIKNINAVYIKEKKTQNFSFTDLINEDIYQNMKVFYNNYDKDDDKTQRITNDKILSYVKNDINKLKELLENYKDNQDNQDNQDDDKIIKNLLYRMVDVRNYNDTFMHIVLVPYLGKFSTDNIKIIDGLGKKLLFLGLYCNNKNTASKTINYIDKSLPKEWYKKYIDRGKMIKNLEEGIDACEASEKNKLSEVRDNLASTQASQLTQFCKKNEDELSKLYEQYTNLLDKDFYKDPVFKRIRQYRNKRIPLGEFEKIIKINFDKDYFKGGVTTTYNNYELYGIKYNKKIIDTINNPDISRGVCGNIITHPTSTISTSSTTINIQDNIRKYLKKIDKTFIYKELVNYIVLFLKKNHSKNLEDISSKIIKGKQNKCYTANEKKKETKLEMEKKLKHLNYKLEKYYYNRPPITNDRKNERITKYKEYRSKVKKYVEIIEDTHTKIYKLIEGTNFKKLTETDTNIKPITLKNEECTAESRKCTNNFEDDGISDYKSVNEQLTHYIEQYKKPNKIEIIKSVINLLKHTNEYYNCYKHKLNTFKELVVADSSNYPEINDNLNMLNSLIQEISDHGGFKKFYDKYTTQQAINTWSHQVLKDNTENKLVIPDYLNSFDESYMY